MEKVLKVRILNQKVDETLDEFNNRLSIFLENEYIKVLDVQHTPVIINEQILATVIIKYIVLV